VAMLTVSGGGTSLIGNLGDAAGLRFPPLGAATSRRLQAILGVAREFGNPVDTVGLPRLRKEGNIGAVMQALQEDDDIHLIGLVLGMRAEGSPAHRDLIEAMAEAAKRARKPLMIVSFMSNSLTRHWRGFSRARGLPLIEDLNLGLQAVRHLVDYAAFRRKARHGAAIAAPARLDRPDVPAGRILTEVESKRILGRAGLPVTREALARDAADAVRVAAEIGGAVALKIQSPDIPHKSDAGGVYLDARTPSEVGEAARQVLENATRNCPQAVIDGILVQEMVEAGVEFVLGMTYDDQFGPLIVCGAGGVTVEVFKDAAVLLPPLVPEDVRAALRGLKASRLLDGFRGAGARDVDALVACCMRFCDFVVATDGQFAAIDLNPVIVGPAGLGVRIADALIETRAS
jgi:acetate---CoA ligase (ADP-forming)